MVGVIARKKCLSIAKKKRGRKYNHIFDQFSTVMKL